MPVEAVTLVSDDFNRADAATLGANWTKATPVANLDLTISGNEAVGLTVLTDHADYWTGPGWTDPVDHWAEVIIGTDTGGDGGPIIRSNGSDHYLLDVNPGGMDIYFVLGGGPALVVSVPGVAHTTGDAFRFGAIGQNLYVWKNSTQIFQTPDTNFDGVTTGGPKVGLLLFSTNMAVNAWSAGKFFLPSRVGKSRRGRHPAVASPGSYF